ncbi:hypothetical protein [Methylorubrum zatmanii]
MPTTTKDEAARTPGQADWRTVMRNLIAEHDKNICLHEETHRGGAIWTICAQCGRKWADDEGGFQPYEEPPAVTAAWAALKCEDVSPAPASPGVPDSLREAFKAADLHECWVNGDTADVMTNPYPGCGNFNQIAARCATGDLWRKRAVAIAESLNFVRALLSTHPAGQSAGSGAEDRQHAAEVELQEIEDGAYGSNPMTRGAARDRLDTMRAEPALECTGCGSRESIETIQARGFSSCCPERKMQPAPDSTRTGDEGTEEAVEKIAWIILANLRTDVPVADIRRKLDEKQSGRFGLGRSWCQALDTARRQARAILAARPAAPEAQGAETFQARADRWLEKVTEGDPTDLPERRDRYSEESLELAQALGATREGMHQLVDYVFSRPVGEPGDEMGDTKLCLANLASWAKLNMDACGEAMLARRSKPESVAKIRRKRSTRHGRGPLPGLDAPAPPTSSGQGGR